MSYLGRQLAKWFGRGEAPAMDQNERRYGQGYGETEPQVRPDREGDYHGEWDAPGHFVYLTRKERQERRERYHSDLECSDVQSLVRIVKEAVELLKELKVLAKENKDFSIKTARVNTHDLERMEIKIMSSISDFSTRMDQYNQRHDTAVAGIQTDVDWLKAEIAKLQNTQGQITPEDQGLLDGIEARASAMATKIEALDALTTPTPSGEGDPSNPATGPRTGETQDQFRARQAREVQDNPRGNQSGGQRNR